MFVLWLFEMIRIQNIKYWIIDIPFVAWQNNSKFSYAYWLLPKMVSDDIIKFAAENVNQNVTHTVGFAFMRPRTETTSLIYAAASILRYRAIGGLELMSFYE